MLFFFCYVILSEATLAPSVSFGRVTIEKRETAISDGLFGFISAYFFSTSVTSTVAFERFLLRYTARPPANRP